MWQVAKDNQVVFKGSSTDCYQYLLNHQPQSTRWAEKYAGWKMEESNNDKIKLVRGWASVPERFWEVLYIDSDVEPEAYKQAIDDGFIESIHNKEVKCKAP